MSYSPTFSFLVLSFTFLWRSSTVREPRFLATFTGAIAVFREFQPDIALLDIGLPDMNGYELCQRLAALPDGQQTVFFSWLADKTCKTLILL